MIVLQKIFEIGDEGLPAAYSLYCVATAAVPGTSNVDQEFQKLHFTTSPRKLAFWKSHTALATIPDPMDLQG